MDLKEGVTMNIAIIGCGIAGVTTATTLKQNSTETLVTIYTDEKHPYYPRPELYRILSGEAQPNDIYAFSEEWFESRGITVQTGRKVVDIDTVNKRLVFDDSGEANYDKLLLGTGAHPFVPPIKGIDKPGVFTLRSINDALAIREYAKKTTKAIIIGGGLLGLEFAASLHKLGQQVDVVEIFPRLLPNQLDTDSAEVFKSQIEKLGINFILGVKTQEILGDQIVSGVALDNARSLQGELVLFSAGIRPNVELAAKAGIKVNKGVVVDQHLRTSAPDVFAAGDVVEFDSRVYGIIPAAEEQAKIAAINMLGKTREYHGTIPSNTLKVVGIDLTSIGLTNPESSQYEEVKKGSKEKGVYKKIVLDQGRIIGAIVLGDRRAATAIMRLMESRKDITRFKDAILEDTFDFRKVLTSE
jgi:nitrite reductase (NADH) large subunit